MRYFLESVSTILYYYLVLIRPLVQHLEKQVLGEQLGTKQSCYLWPAKHSLLVERPSSLHVGCENKDGMLDRSVQDITTPWQRPGFWPIHNYVVHPALGWGFGPIRTLVKKVTKG